MVKQFRRSNKFAEARIVDSQKTAINGTLQQQIASERVSKHNNATIPESRQNSQPASMIRGSRLEKKIAASELRASQQKAVGIREPHSRSPSPPNSSNEQTNTNGKGMQSWETAASYIRRKNRERRQRNRTVATSEDLLRSAVEYRDSLAAAHTTHDSHTDAAYANAPSSGRALSPTSALVGRGAAAADAFYSHTRPTAVASNAREPTTGSLFTYVRPRYHDESYRRKDGENETPLSPARFNVSTAQAFHVRDERAKSRSIHDLSPDRPEMASHYTATTAAKYGTGASSSYAGRYDSDQRQSPALQSWAFEPRRFHVYQTRAEREAEKNTTVK
ncbi:hypothetical protein Tcan_14139 [Toxocara canis]|uniref:Uncharacterized protein n=1 Tax=Toxocara canis TaxID=6265 RepID=A0A0B2UUM8_TOXCA|nr:hypothetical protein Tcan_14139 [Toxocara canis]